MQQPALTLYTDTNFFSPYAMSVYVALKEKGLTFALQTINLATSEHLQHAYTEVSLTRRVPTLRHADFLLSESTAIAEYLEEQFPAPQHERLYPENRYLRAKAREIQAWLRSDLLPIRHERSTEVLFAGKRCPPLSPEAQKAAEKLFAALELLLPEGEKHLFGDWSLADTDAALMLNRLVMNGDRVPQRLKSYAQFQWRRDAVQQWVALSAKPV